MKKNPYRNLGDGLRRLGLWGSRPHIAFIPATLTHTPSKASFSYMWPNVPPALREAPRKWMATQHTMNSRIL